MIHRLLIIFTMAMPLQVFSQIGYYLKVNGTDWTESTIVYNTDKLVFGVKDGSNLTPCYYMQTSKISQDNVVLFQPKDIKNPWNIDLATALPGKTGIIKIEMTCLSCSGSSKNSWVFNIILNQASNSTTTNSSTTSNTTSANTITRMAPAGKTAAGSILKSAPRTQHVVAQVVFTNNSARVDKVTFVTGFPVTNSYQKISNLSSPGAIVKTDASDAKYLEYTFSNVPVGGKVKAKYEYDVTTYDISMNTSKASCKTYTKTPNYTLLTRSVPVQCDLGNAKLAATCNTLWSQSNNDYMTYARKVAEWMSKNTEWKFTGGILPLNDFLDNPSNGIYKGDCGSLSNAFTAMLRYKGIPARLLIGYGTGKMTEADAKLHAWLEFYIEGFGWIPVDPSYRINNMIEIGKITHKGIIVSKDAFYDVSINGNVYPNMFIQTYLWAFNGDIPKNSYTVNFTAVSSNFSE